MTVISAGKKSVTAYSPNVAGLAALTGLTSGQPVELLGYHASGDGGGQQLIYRGTGLGSLPGGAEGLWYFDGPGSDDYYEAVDKDTLHVIRAGANASQSSTVNRLRIQFCVDKIQETGGGVIQFPRQKLLIDQPISVTGGNITFRGTHARGQDGGDKWFSAPGIYTSAADVDAFRIIPGTPSDTGWKFESLKIACEFRSSGTTADNYGIRFQTAEFFGQFVIRDCEIWGFAEDFYAQNTGNSLAGLGIGIIDSCYFHGASRWGIKCDGVFNNITISNSSIRQNARHDISATEYFGSYKKAVADQPARLALNDTYITRGSKVLQRSNNVIYQYNGGGTANAGNWSTTALASSHGGIRLSWAASVTIDECDLEGQKIGAYLDNCSGIKINGAYVETCENVGILLEECSGFQVGPVFGEKDVNLAPTVSDTSLVFWRCRDGELSVQGSFTGYVAQSESIKFFDFNRYMKIYAGQCFNVELPWDRVKFLSSLDPNGSEHTWFAHTPNKVIANRSYPKSTPAFTGQAPFNATIVDDATVFGPLSQRLHVKKLTATGSSGSMYVGHDAAHPLSYTEVGDIASASTWVRFPSSNAGKPYMDIWQGLNNASPGIYETYESDEMQIPEDTWILWRWVKRLASADLTGPYRFHARAYALVPGDVIFLYGQSNGIYSHFPVNPMLGNVNANHTTYILTEGPQVDFTGVTIHAGEGTPTGGTWGTGERIFLPAPVDGTLGVQCIAGGNPGAWASIAGAASTDTSITSGVLLSATANRVPDFGGFNLTLNNIANFSVPGTDTVSIVGDLTTIEGSTGLTLQATGSALNCSGGAVSANGVTLAVVNTFNTAAAPLLALRTDVDSGSFYSGLKAPEGMNQVVTTNLFSSLPGAADVPQMVTITKTGGNGFLGFATIPAGGGTDTSITTGAIAAATANRTVEFGGFDLAFNSIDEMSLNGASMAINGTVESEIAVGANAATVTTAGVTLTGPSVFVANSNAANPAVVNVRTGGSTNAVNVTAPAGLAANRTFTLPSVNVTGFTALPSVTEMVTMTSAGVLATQTIPAGGGGSDSSLTTGTLAVAIDDRVADFSGTHSLTFTGITDTTFSNTNFIVVATGNVDLTHQGTLSAVFLRNGSPALNPARLAFGNGAANNITIDTPVSNISYVLTLPLDLPAEDSMLLTDPAGELYWSAKSALNLVTIQEKVSSFTLAIEDTGRQTNVTNAVSVANVTIPTDTVNISDGATFEIVRRGAGDVAVVLSGGVTLKDTDQAYVLGDIYINRVGGRIMLRKESGDTNTWSIAGEYNHYLQIEDRPNNFTVTVKDHGKTLRVTGTVIVVVPPLSTVLIPKGWYVNVLRAGTGAVTFSPAGTATIASESGFLGIASQHCGATLTKLDNVDAYSLIGRLG